MAAPSRLSTRIFSIVPSFAVLQTCLDKLGVSGGETNSGMTLLTGPLKGQFLARAYTRMETKLYVGNLAYSATENDLHRLFTQAGAVQSVKVIKDRDTAAPRDSLLWK